MGEMGWAIFRYFAIGAATVLAVPVVNWVGRVIWGSLSVDDPWKRLKRRGEERALRRTKALREQRGASLIIRRQ